jgi:hypothetical protein
VFLVEIVQVALAAIMNDACLPYSGRQPMRPFNLMQIAIFEQGMDASTDLGQRDDEPTPSVQLGAIGHCLSDQPGFGQSTLARTA